MISGMICEKINFLKNVMLKFHEVHVFVLNLDSQHIVSRFGAFNFFNGFFGVKSHKEDFHTQARKILFLRVQKICSPKDLF